MAVGKIVPIEETIVEPETGEKPVIKVESPQEVFEQKKNILINRRIVWYIWLVIEILFLIRFILKFFGANPWNTFNILIEALTFPFWIPFSNVFTSTTFGDGENQIEWSTLFAMLIFFIIAFTVSRFFKLRKPIDPKEAEIKVENPV